MRSAFRGLTTVRLRYDLLLCLPSCRSRPDLRLAIEGVYIRASNGLVTRAVAGYIYSANCAICTGGNSHPLDHQLASLHYPGALIRTAVPPSDRRALLAAPERNTQPARRTTTESPYHEPQHVALLRAERGANAHLARAP